MDAEKKDTAQEYRDAAKKAALDAQDAALLARQSAGEANRIVQEIADIRNKYRQQLEQLPADLERTNKQLSELRIDLDKNASHVETELAKRALLNTNYRIRSAAEGGDKYAVADYNSNLGGAMKVTTLPGVCNLLAY
jgi:chromosome segregation ATPase